MLDTAHSSETLDSPDVTAIVRDGPLEVDYGVPEARVEGEVLPLTPTELRLLMALVEHDGRFLTARRLVADVWHDEAGTTGRVKIYVGYLRRKFREHGIDAPIETRRGFGYRYVGFSTTEQLQAPPGPVRRITGVS